MSSKGPEQSLQKMGTSRATAMHPAQEWPCPAIHGGFWKALRKVLTGIDLYMNRVIVPFMHSKLVSFHKWPFLPRSAFSAGFRLRRTGSMPHRKPLCLPREMRSIFNWGGLDPDKNCLFLNRKPTVSILQFWMDSSSNPSVLRCCQSRYSLARNPYLGQDNTETLPGTMKMRVVYTIPLFIWISRRSTPREHTRQIRRYKSITVIQTSNVKNVADISSMPWNVSSCMEMTETMEESFMTEINCPANGGSTFFAAWGKIMWRS